MRTFSLFIAVVPLLTIASSLDFAPALVEAHRQVRRRDDVSSSSEFLTSTSFVDAASSSETSGGVENYDSEGGAGYAYGELDSSTYNMTGNPDGGNATMTSNSAPFSFDEPFTANITSHTENTTMLSYTNIVDVTGTFQLHKGNNSNVYLSAANPSDTQGVFAGTNNVYTGDSAGNIFVYYSDEMSALNISRLRLVPSSAVPQTARFVSLAPFSTGDEYVYVAVDSLANSYYLAGCNILDSLTKVFLVTQPVTDLEKLTDPDLAYVLTGGIVTGCSLLSMEADGPMRPSSSS